jgi:hypothetical protein
MRTKLISKGKVSLPIFAASLVLALALTLSCSSDGGGGNGNGNGNWEGDFTKGWPGNSILAEYGLSGMPTPAGATNIEYERVNEDYGKSLGIVFTCSSSNDAAIHTWLTSNGWSVDYGPTDYDGYNVAYTKANFGATYNRSNGTQCVISVIES